MRTGWAALQPQAMRAALTETSVCSIIYTPADNRSSWRVLEEEALALIQSVTARLGAHKKVLCDLCSLATQRQAPHTDQSCRWSSWQNPLAAASACAWRAQRRTCWSAWCW